MYWQATVVTLIDNFWQVCQIISSIKLSSRNYIKPGRSLPLSKDVNTVSSEDGRRKNLLTSTDANNNFSSYMGTHQNSTAIKTRIGKNNGLDSLLLSSTPVVPVKASSRQNEVHGSMHNYSHESFINGLSNNHIAHATPVNGFQNKIPDDIVDDDLLEVVNIAVSNVEALHIDL